MGVKHQFTTNSEDRKFAANCLLLNSPVPQLVINRAFSIVATSDSCQDLFVFNPKHISQILTSESFRKFAAFLSTLAKGSVDLVYKIGSQKESKRTYINQQDDYFYLTLFDVEDNTAASSNTDANHNTSHDKLNLNDALIGLEELQERTEELRQEAEDRKNYLRKIIDTTPSMIDVRDENGNILLANKALADELNCDVKYLIGKKLSDFVFSETDRAKLSTKHKEVFSNWEPAYFPMDNVSFLTNKPLYVKEHKMPFSYKGQKSVLSINLIIGDLVESERQLQHSRMRYKRIFEHSPVGIFHFDSAGRVKRCNQKFAQIIGESVENLLGFDMIEGLENKKVADAIYDALQKGEGEYEGWYHSVSGKKSTYTKAKFKAINDDTDKITGGVGIVEDLTNFIHTAQENIDSRNLLDAIFNSLEDTILVFDKDRHLIVSNLTDNQDAQHAEKACFRCFTQNNKKACETCHVEQVFNTGETTQWDTFEEEKQKHYEIRLLPVKDSTGSVNKIIEHIRDITDRKQFEEKLETAKKTAEESEKLKTAFLQNISHEIRTPMNSIMGFSELIQEEGLTEEQRINYGQIIKSNTSWLLNVVDQIILLSKIESSQLQFSPERLNFNLLVREFRSITEAKITEQSKGRLRIITHLPLSDEMAFIRTDYNMFTQLMETLIDNAVKFSDSGVIEIGYRLHFGHTIAFYIKDEGKGIPEDCQELVFLPFRQVDREDYKRGGNGLGLAIAKGLSQCLGATIRLHSQEGKGTEVSIGFPYRLLD